MEDAAMKTGYQKARYEVIGRMGIPGEGFCVKKQRLVTGTLE